MQEDGTIVFLVLYRLLGFNDRHYQCFSPDVWNFEVAQTGSHTTRTSVQLQHELQAAGK